MTKGDTRVMTNTMPRVVLVTLAAALVLSACSSQNSQDSRLGSFLVAPGKYQLYDCRQLAASAEGFLSRQKVLREANAKAEAAPGGGLISAVAYSGDIGVVEGNLDELRREVRAKNCNPPPRGLMR